jgi:hypothetical protein
LEQLEGRALLSISSPAVINYAAAPTGNIDIFVADQTDGSQREFHNGSWIDLGTPAIDVTLLVTLKPAVTTYQTSGGEVEENVFVIGAKENSKPGQFPGTALYLDSYNGTGWKWSDLGNPAKGVVPAPFLTRK